MTTAKQPVATTPSVREDWRDQILVRYSDLGLFHSLEYDVIMAVIAEARSVLSAACSTGTFMMYAQTANAVPTLALSFDFLGEDDRCNFDASRSEITADAIAKVKHSIQYGLKLLSSRKHFSSKIYGHDSDIVMNVNTNCGRLLLSTAFTAGQKPENEYLSRAALLQAAVAILANVRYKDNLLLLGDEQQREYLTAAGADAALKVLQVVDQAFAWGDHPAIIAWEAAQERGDIDPSRSVFH